MPPVPKPSKRSAAEKRSEQAERRALHYGGSEDWPALKHRVFTRDRWRCVLCPRSAFAGDALACAHIVGVQMGGTRVGSEHAKTISQERNLVTLCWECHTLVDQSKHRAALRERIAAYLTAHYDARTTRNNAE